MIIRRILLLCVAVLCPLIAAAENPQYAASKSEGKVKVFILAGQSNMEGRGFPEPLTWQVGQEKYRERYTHFIKDGDYDAFTKKVKETVLEQSNILNLKIKMAGTLNLMLKVHLDT